MKYHWIIALAVITTPAFAQQPPSETLYDLKVTVADINVIAKGLGTLPYAEVAPLMNKLQIQINQQQKPVAVPAPAPVENK